MKIAGNKAVYTEYVALSNQKRDGRTDQRTDGRTQALIESLRRD